jgi:hypothetical protein
MGLETAVNENEDTLQLEAARELGLSMRSSSIYLLHVGIGSKSLKR